MKKTGILMFALLPIMAMAQESNNNASTAEAIIGACPALPSAKEMVDGDPYDFTQAIAKLMRRVDEIQKPQAQQQFDGIVTQANDALRKQGLGITVEDAANDNPNVLNAANKMAAKELRKLGINKDIESLRKNGLSTAEKNALIANQMKMESGLSMAEAKKLQGMSSEEMMAYIKANPEMANQLAQQSKQFQKQNKGTITSTVSREKKRQQYQKQIEKLTAPEKEMDRLFLNEKKDIAKKTAEKWEACKASYPAKTGKMQIEEGDDGWIYVWTEEEQKEVNRLNEQCNIECWTLWHNAVSQQLGRIKALLPNAYKANEIAVKMSKEVDGVDIDNNAPLVVANKYLETAKEYANVK